MEIDRARSSLHGGDLDGGTAQADDLPRSDRIGPDVNEFAHVVTIWRATDSYEDRGACQSG